MIKLVHLFSIGAGALSLAVSDGSGADRSAAELIARDTVLTRPLAVPGYVAQTFIEAGALAWPRGFELSAFSLHRRLGESSALARSAA